MAVVRSKPVSAFRMGPQKNRRRSSSEDSSSVTTLPLDDSVNSAAKTEHNLRRSILRYSSNELSLQHSFSSDTPKRVTFGKVHIHSHAYTLGDSPAVTKGVPLTVDWKPFESHTVDLDRYENDKPDPRQKEAMILPASLREGLVRTRGFSRGEIKEAAEEVERARNQRVRSSRDGRLLRNVEKWLKRLKTGKQSSLELSHH